MSATPKEEQTPDLDDIEVSLAPDGLIPSNSEPFFSNIGQPRKGGIGSEEINDNMGPDV